MMQEQDYYDAGIKTGRKYERDRITAWLMERQKRNAVVVNINELLNYLKSEEDGKDKG